MKQLRVGAALVAALHCGIAGAQGHSPSAHTGPGAKEAMPAKAAPPGPATEGAGSKYRSPFAGYRPFTPQEPQKGWRAANDEVHEIGGHAGLLKGAKDDAAQTPRVRKP